MLLRFGQVSAQKSQNCLFCFSNEAPDFLQCSFSYSCPGERRSQILSATQSSMFLPSGNVFVVLWEITKLVLTALSLDV